MAYDQIIVTVDGLSASGKSTLSKLLAERLHFVHLNTGLLYRAVAYLLGTSGAAAALPEQLTRADIEELLKTNHVHFERDQKLGSRLMCGGEDITDRLHDPRITELTSAFAAQAAVREALVHPQRNAFLGESLVAEGRDLGTVIFPDAAVKFFVIGDPQVRARRRALEMAQRQGLVPKGPAFEQLVEETTQGLAARDERDQSRQHAPLKAAPDAILIDNTRGTLEAVLSGMLKRVEPVLLKLTEPG